MQSCAGRKDSKTVDLLPFQDPGLPVEDRVADLTGRLTLEEKAGLMLYDSRPVDRLGIPAYNWWNECLHGVARAGRATVFPQAIGLAATFDEGLIRRIAAAIGDEARAKHHDAVRKGYRGQYGGLSFWTPNINIYRDPRWGRGQETYGEDPFLTSVMGAAFVRGLQGDHPFYLKAAACAKHYVVHSGPEPLRHQFNAVPPEQDFRETYLPAFRSLVNAGVEAVMCAYNRTYGDPCCGSPSLLGDILRKEWGFKGHVVSDCWALDDIWARHKVVETREEAAAMAVKAGVNLNCGYIYRHIPEAVTQGLITEREVDEALAPLMRTRFRLGLLGPEDKVPYAAISPEKVNCEAHRNLAYEAACKSIVLLKNENDILPLDAGKIRSLMVAGPLAMDLAALWGNYNGFSGRTITLLEGIIGRVNAGTVVEYNPGFMLHCDSLFQGFWQARRAEAVIVCIGLNSLFEGEEGEAMLNNSGGDRADIQLPRNQVEYVRRIREQIGDVPLILVITGGGAIALGDVAELADAVLFVWYPGEQGGNALADILFGTVNPSGRLPVTFYRSVDDLPPFDDYSMQGRTYRFFSGEPLYPFGYGLSYSRFNYLQLETDQDEVSAGDTLTVRITVENKGERDGEEVVQLYIADADDGSGGPIRSLEAFGRIRIQAGESGELVFGLPTDRLSAWDAGQGRYRVNPGKYILQAGSSSSDIRLIREFSVR
ncbi:MAG: glycoside hydrolase family 3 C-terminal domain-containing protein [Bacteroidales bacterium]|nr:glycoside hydrolase family 3 C-terminal domain-containing protein [Bacteroidales bacterium]